MSARIAAALAALDGEELLQQLDDLGQIGARTGGGVDRLAFSPADLAGRAWVAEQMRAAGLEVARDGAGNVIGRLAGSEPGRAPIALGSHTDTVPNGGRFDGALGVLAAIAAARAVRGAGLTLRHPLEVIDFAGEEATIAGGTFGSRAMAGLLADAALAAPAWDGRPVAELLRGAGLDPAGVAGAGRPVGSLAAYLELHIEQGGTLEAAGVPVGVVEGIVGIRRYVAQFAGSANHAGTTPMAQRRDALVMAAPLVGAVREVAEAHKIVGTVGTVRVEPNAPNVIPGRVELGLEIRGLDEAVLDAAAAAIEAEAVAAGGRLVEISRKEPVACAAVVLEAIEAGCAAVGLERRRMASGAGHDAMCLAALAPVGMIFVPSAGGVSHAPEEWTAPEQCVAGARALLAGLLELDERLA
jgi:N-carbamoyl-L-amino-acid hydrolase